MPEQLNVEVAHKLSEHEKTARAKRRWEEVIEILEVVLLALAAIATAWGGYQAARGDGHQSVLYGEATTPEPPTIRSSRRCWCAGSARSTGRPSTPG